MSDTPTTREIKTSAIQETHDYGVMLESHEIFTHGQFNPDGEDLGTDFQMANKFLKNIRFLEHLNSKNKPIIIHGNNVGGDWSQGMVIYDAIKNCKVYVVYVCHGIASSMGSIIPQAADFRVCTQHCDWLIHEGATDISPDLIRRQARSWGKYEDRLDERMMEIYAERCGSGQFYKGKTEKEIKSHIKGRLKEKEDWWLSSGEALEHGFVDAIYGSDEYPDIMSLKNLGYEQ